MSQPVPPPATSSQDEAATQARLEETFGQLPLYFVENQGQMDEQVAYYIQGSDKTIYFTPDGVTFALAAPMTQTAAGPSAHTASLRPLAFRPERETPPERQRWVVKLDFVGANPDVRPVGDGQTEAIISYFKGPQGQWHTGLSTYSRIIYRDLWSGIDLVYYGTVNQLKYEFIVHPGADPAQIRLAYRGATDVALNAAGQLEVTTPVGGFADDTPVAYQEIDGQRVDVPVAYALVGGNAVDGFPERIERTSARSATSPNPFNPLPESDDSALFAFQIAPYDPTLPLVLDPAVLVYCGYIGGSGSEASPSIAVDGAGNAYVTGYTTSIEATFPITGGLDLTYNGAGARSCGDAFVAKLNAAGTALVYAGYIGGSDDDLGYDIAVDGAGNAYVTGETWSTETTFPATIGPDLTFNGMYDDAFVAKVNAAGTALVYAGYIGGSGQDLLYGIAVDGAGNAYVAGMSSYDAADFPVAVGLDPTYNGGVFVAKVNAAGTALVYAGHIGGYAEDEGYDIAVDGSGNAYVTGRTYSSEVTFPVTIGPDLTFNGGWDAFVAKVNAAGTALVYAGYIGGSDDDWGRSIAVDGAGNAYVTGSTISTEATFPVAVGPDSTYNGAGISSCGDAFVAKVNAAGTALVYAGYIGGSDDDLGYDIAVDGSGNAYVTGVTWSTETTFPVTIGPDLTFNGCYDAFVAKVNAAGTALAYAGYIGGSGLDGAGGIVVDGAGNAYVAGSTTSAEDSFPVTVGPDLTHNGGLDAFVAKVSTGRAIDLTISLYRSVNASERIPYEQILGYFADAVYEMSNGMHIVRNVTIYQSGSYSSTANVLWNASEWPRAHVAGYGQPGLRVWMGDVFPFKDNNGNPVPYDALAQSNRRGAGYTLAHEWGHHYYGLYDEYAASCGNNCNDVAFPKPDDRPVRNSVMNSQWNAVGGDFNWLNFSVARNNTRRTAQHRVYAASGWETVARPASEDPRDGARVARPVRPYYPELIAVASAMGQDASLELPTTPAATTRSELNIVWVGGGTALSLAQEGFAYWAAVRSVLGAEIDYPGPVVLAASAAGVDVIARASVTTSVEAPDGSVTLLSLKDDGIAPDTLADDGIYSGILPYNQGGSHLITVTLTNEMGNAVFTQASAAHAIGPNGETYSPTLQSVGESFTVVATTTMIINNFQVDDHSDTPQSATVLLPDNVDVPGRIDRAGDVDVFRVTPSQTGTLALRVTNLALGMQPRIRVLGADGITVIHEFAFQSTAGEYFFTLLNVTANEPFYVEISHLNSSAATGLYDISAGRPLANDQESPVYSIYLPLIARDH